MFKGAVFSAVHPVARTCTTHSQAILILLGGALIAASHLQRLPAWLGDFNAQRLLQIAVIALVAMLILLDSRTRGNWLRTYFDIPSRARWGLALVLLAGLVSSSLAPSSRHAMLELSLVLLLFGLGIAIAQARRLLGHKADILILSLLATSATLYLVRFLSGYLAVVLVGENVPVRELFTGFSNVRFLNQYLSWLLPLLAAVVLLRPQGGLLWRVLSLLLLAGCWMLLLATASRGGLVAVGAGAFVVIGVFGRHALPWLRLQTKAALGGLVVYWMMFRWLMPIPTSVTERLADATHDPARLALWRLAWRMIMDNPIVGVGPMHYAYYPNGIAAHPHNALLQLAAEWGLPAALALLVLLGWGAFAWCLQARREAAKIQSTEKKLVRVSLTASMATAAAHSMVSGIMVMPVSQLLAALILGWALGIYLSARSDTSEATTSLRRHFLIITVLLAALLSLGRGSTPDLLAWRVEQQLLDNRAPGLYKPAQQYQPRFWRQGLIGTSPYEGRSQQ